MKIGVNIQRKGLEYIALPGELLESTPFNQLYYRITENWGQYRKKRFGVYRFTGWISKIDPVLPTLLLNNGKLGSIS